MKMRLTNGFYGFHVIHKQGIQVPFYIDSLLLAAIFQMFGTFLIFVIQDNDLCNISQVKLLEYAEKHIIWQNKIHY